MVPHNNWSETRLFTVTHTLQHHAGTNDALERALQSNKKDDSTSRKYGMEINSTKTQIITNSEIIPK